MFRRGTADISDPETGLAARAAWLSYVAGWTQEEIAARLHVSRVKVARLIGQAHRAGIVRVFVENRAADCIELEEALAERYGLKFASVGHSLASDGDLPLLSLGDAGSRYLHSILEQGRASVIGVGHGRTLAAVVDSLPRVPRPNVKFVSLLGGLVRNAIANPFDIIHRLCERTDGDGYFLPAPFVVDSAADRAMLMRQRCLQPVFELAAQAELCLVGIGEVGKQAFMSLTGMLTADEFLELEAAGAAGEILGQFLDERGRPLAIDINQRSVGPKLDQFRGKEVVAVAGGSGKVAAIDAALHSGMITGLITDEGTAAQIIQRRGDGDGALAQAAALRG
jgi:DNA-binding transcriptional regulator LsrR (DeoR family)